LGQERGVEGVSKECRSAVVTGKLKRSGYRGAVDVVYGGEKPAKAETDAVEKGKGKQKQQQKQQDQQKGQKRKAEGEVNAGGEQPLSKRQAKKLAHEARMQAAAGEASTGPGATSAET
jgi:ribonuclease P/MRP protein subunit RPP1